MSQQASVGNFFINACLVWFWSAALDSIFPDLSLGTHIICTLLCSFVTWAFYKSIVLPIVDLLLNRKMIMDLLEQGKDPKEIVKMLNEKHANSPFEYEVEEIEEEPKQSNYEERELKVTFLNTDKPFGFYMDEPIFEQIMVDGLIYEFTGSVDMKKMAGVILDANSLILKPGLIYKKV